MKNLWLAKPTVDPPARASYIVFIDLYDINNYFVAEFATKISSVGSIFCTAFSLPRASLVLFWSEPKTTPGSNLPDIFCTRIYLVLRKAVAKDVRQLRISMKDKATCHTLRNSCYRIQKWCIWSNYWQAGTRALSYLNGYKYMMYDSTGLANYRIINHCKTISTKNVVRRWK